MMFVFVVVERAERVVRSFEREGGGMVSRASMMMKVRVFVGMRVWSCEDGLLVVLSPSSTNWVFWCMSWFSRLCRMFDAVCVTSQYVYAIPIPGVAL